MNEKRVYRLPEVLKNISSARSTLYKRIADGTFPPPIGVGGRVKVWLGSEIDRVISARAAGLGDDAVRALVRELIAARQLLLAAHTREVA